MAYNKTKYLDAAQKLLQQGKVPQAIEEYKTILKHEPRDQVTLMTLGDLFVRQGETFQALEYFERLAQIFLAEGFVAKAIAIYKKIAKLAPEQARPIERLAELYVQQGVLSEARPIYLHLAEQHQRAGRHAQAAALLRKLLEAEPDSPRVQTRLAELLLAMGQPAEAAAAYRAAAEHLHRRGDHAEAIQFADRALQTDPGDLGSAILKARALIGTGQRSQAIALLKSVPQTGGSSEAVNLLLDLYLEDGELEPASELAEKIFAAHPKRFAAAHRVAGAYLEARKPEPALLLLDRVREAMTDAGEHEALSQSLQQAAEQLPGRLEPREWLVQLYQRASDSFRLPDALADLAAVLEAAGNHGRARQVYEQILDRDPENESARRNYESALARLGPGGAEPEAFTTLAPPTAQAGPAPGGEPPLDEATQQFVTQSLTDVDLFSSYGLTQKAIDLLEVVLERAPRHAPSIERLLDLYLGAGNERRTAELASQLHRILTERGDFAAAERFEQLHRRFERAAELSAAEPAAAPPEAPPEVSAPAAAESTPAPEPVPAPVPANAEIAAVARDLDSELTIHEVDLSDEWATLAGELKTALSPSFLGSAANNTAERGEETPAAQAVEMPGVQAIEMAEQAQNLAASAEPQTLRESAAEPEMAAASSESANAGNGVSADLPVFTLDFEASSSAGDSETAAPSADDFLHTLSAELDAALPALKTPATAPEAMPAATGGAAPAAPPEAPPDASAPGPLSDLFDEFRAELDALAKEEDPETHYNLGVAYREMGLLEEAISEFQKVAKAGKGMQAFRYAMQCCTLLGLSFMEKGQPLIAAMWYERALEIPGLDQETILALRYDLGVAQELAGETSAARKSFSQVYGMNIDYRDVAERLAALGKGS